MLRRFALSAGLIVLGALACAPKASAQSVNVDANITIPSTCSFGTPSVGLLIRGSDNPSELISLADSGGTPSNVSITCNGPSSLMISNLTLASKPSTYSGHLSGCGVRVSPTSGTGFGGSTYNNGDCSSSSTYSNFITNDAGTTGNLKVEMYGALSDTLLPGTYTLRTTLTAVP